MRDVILAIDQGTSGTTCLVLDEKLRPLGRGYSELTLRFPQPGWVEQDPEEIWTSALAAAEAALADAAVRSADLAAIGIANQRETTIVWDRRNGRAVAPAIVWQDRRTASRCRELPRELIRERTGLVPDPYFSATKLEWLLARIERRAGLAFGTVDSWLAWKLTGGDVHVTDPTNASRTMLFDLGSLEWDDELLELFGVERQLLPELCGSSEVVGEAALLGARVPIAGLAGDQQASLFGHACFDVGQAKATYGTGSFVLVAAGDAPDAAPAGLLKTAAAGSGRAYAFEGAILASGAAIQWLRDGLGIIGDAAETEELAVSVPSTDGVHLVPAFAGLGSPHWEPGARGLVSGLTRGTTRAHVARAALEAIAFQVADVVERLPVPVQVMRADGGATANRFLMQFQADILGVRVEVAEERETTALGAGALAGRGIGLWREPDGVARRIRHGAIYEPAMSREEAASRREEWQLAVQRALLR